MEAAIFTRVFRAFLCGSRAQGNFFFLPSFEGWCSFFPCSCLLSGLSLSSLLPDFSRHLQGDFSLFLNFRAPEIQKTRSESSKEHELLECPRLLTKRALLERKSEREGEQKKRRTKGRAREAQRERAITTTTTTTTTVFSSAFWIRPRGAAAVVVVVVRRLLQGLEARRRLVGIPGRRKQRRPRAKSGGAEERYSELDDAKMAAKSVPRGAFYSFLKASTDAGKPPKRVKWSTA